MTQEWLPCLFCAGNRLPRLAKPMGVALTNTNENDIKFFWSLCNENQAGRLCILFIVFLGHLVILFNGPPKPEACWRVRTWKLYEGLVLSAGAQHGSRIFQSLSKRSIHWTILLPSYIPSYASLSNNDCSYIILRHVKVNHCWVGVLVPCQEPQFSAHRGRRMTGNKFQPRHPRSLCRAVHHQW